MIKGWNLGTDSGLKVKVTLASEEICPHQTCPVPSSSHPYNKSKLNSLGPEGTAGAVTGV